MKRTRFFPMLAGMLSVGLSVGLWAGAPAHAAAPPPGAGATIAHFGSDIAGLEVYTYSLDREVIGVLRIGGKSAITFKPAEWRSFRGIWQRAKALQSDSYQFVDSVKETGADYNSLLTVTAGPGVQFTINDAPGTLTFTLAPKDFATFDNAVNVVTSSLSAQPH